MDKPEPTEIRVEMDKGAHHAVAVLYKYADNAFTIHAIEQRGVKPLRDNDNTYAELSKAVDAAKKIWYGTLQD